GSVDLAAADGQADRIGARVDGRLGEQGRHAVAGPLGVEDLNGSGECTAERVRGTEIALEGDVAGRLGRDAGPERHLDVVIARRLEGDGARFADVAEALHPVAGR